MTASMIDRKIFNAVIDGDSSVPNIGDYVYYFPDGHAASSSSAADLSSVQIKQPHAVCLITNIKYLADEHSDELYAKITLDPNPSPPIVAVTNSLREKLNRLEHNDPKSFAKVLTRSDANNGGGFSVPKFCAQTVFPRLNFNSKPPKQILVMEDMRGKKWEFRHVYRGSPERHLLTMQWSKFCDAKLLCKDDTVVFVNQDGKLHIGIRRATATSNAEGGSEKLGIGEVLNSFVRDGLGKVKAEEVVEAVRAMEKGESFEVCYYPRIGGVKFMIGKEVVEDSLKVEWREGMKFSMDVKKVETGEDVSFTGWVVDIGRSCLGSYWKMIQVSFDDPSALVHVKSTAVSPWEINPITPMKRSRSEEFDFLTNDTKNYFYNPPIPNFTGVGNSSPYLNYFPTVFPACMQGARQSCTYTSFLSSNTTTVNMPKPEPYTFGSKTEPNTPVSNLTTQNSSEHFQVAVRGQKTRKVVKLFGQIISGGEQTEEIESPFITPSVSGIDDVVAPDTPLPYDKSSFREYL